MATTINASTSAGLVSTADTSGVLQLQAQGTTVLNGELGKALALQGAASTTGCGIAFPATQSASTDVNTLDDYEEGTWTPTDGSGAGLTITTYSSTKYTKIGRLVQIQGIIVYPSTANTATASIAGLPFAGAPYYIAGVTPGFASSVITYLSMSVPDASPYTKLVFNGLNNTGLTNAQMSGIVLYISLCYNQA